MEDAGTRFIMILSLGGITLASDGEALSGLWFDGQKYFGAGLQKEAEERKLPVFEETARWLDIYFSGQEPDFTPKIILHGSEFRREVWKILQKIPYGVTTTYKKLRNRSPRTEESLPCQRRPWAGRSDITRFQLLCRAIGFWERMEVLPDTPEELRKRSDFLRWRKFCCLKRGSHNR